MMALLKIYEDYLNHIQNDNFDFDKFNHYAMVHHSNAIENSTLTIEETFLLLDEHLTPQNKPLEHSLMAVDHLSALKYTVDLAQNKIPLTDTIIKKMSSLIMKSTGSEISAIAGDFDSSKGEYRKRTVRAGTATFMDYKKVPKRVDELVNYINENINSVNGFQEVNELAFDAHLQMVSIHPFADGNGRLSRLIMNYVQEYHNMPLVAIYKEQKLDYFNALQESRAEKDISVFRTFMFQQTEIYLLDKIKEVTSNQKSEKPNGKGLNFLF